MGWVFLAIVLQIGTDQVCDWNPPCKLFASHSWELVGEVRSSPAGAVALGVLVPFCSFWIQSVVLWTQCCMGTLRQGLLCLSKSRLCVNMMLILRNSKGLVSTIILKTKRVTLGYSSDTTHRHLESYGTLWKCKVGLVSTQIYQPVAHSSTHACETEGGNIFLCGVGAEMRTLACPGASPRMGTERGTWICIDSGLYHLLYTFLKFRKFKLSKVASW